ncbi:MAG: hypothetical protein C0412_14580, partial [Flavobacterium sp.]|nr:hypothetical protein [Flavobacterium sp.]
MTKEKPFNKLYPYAYTSRINYFAPSNFGDINAEARAAFGFCFDFLFNKRSIKNYRHYKTGKLNCRQAGFYAHQRYVLQQKLR